MGDRLERFRKEIDRIDKDILLLLAKRGQVGIEISKIKKELDLPIYNPAREREILSSIKDLNEGPLHDSSLELIFKEIFSATRAIEKDLIVSVLGPAGTFSHIAGIDIFGRSLEYRLEATFEALFRSVEDGSSDYGVVPVENSTEGSIMSTFDLLERSSLMIYGEHQIRISHNLLSKGADISKIKKIYTHFMPLAQSKVWLREHLPSVKIEEVSSSSIATSMVKDESEAAIGSKESAFIYALNILAEKIENVSDNRTRFFIISKRRPKKGKTNKSSILIRLADKPGSLYEVMRSFYENGINLSKIESRPARTNKWEYLFFIDFSGHVDDTNVCKAMEDIKGKVNSYRLLGSYPSSLG